VVRIHSGVPIPPIKSTKAHPRQGPRHRFALLKFWPLEFHFFEPELAVLGVTPNIEKPSPGRTPNSALVTLRGENELDPDSIVALVPRLAVLGLVRVFPRTGHGACH